MEQLFFSWALVTSDGPIMEQCLAHFCPSLLLFCPTKLRHQLDRNALKTT